MWNRMITNTSRHRMQQYLKSRSKLARHKKDDDSTFAMGPGMEMIAPEVQEMTRSAGTGNGEDALLELSLGPHHPSTHGVFRMDVALDGERVMKLKPVFGYLHRNDA